MTKTLLPDTDSCYCRREMKERRIFTVSVLQILKMDLCAAFLLVFILPVELGVLNQYVAIAISNKHFTAHTSETLRVVLLLSSNLFDKGKQ